MQVVVPIFNAFEVFSNCVNSLQQHNSQDDILFIDDASTDPQVGILLRQICAEHPSWQFRQNDSNLGFVKTANIGLRATAGDTVLLNSDTQVCTGWLDGLRYAAKHCPQLGSATPWSNNAEICSLPENLTNNKIPANLDEMASCLQQRHQATYPELPTAVGFCMLITAEAKRRVGYFDETAFGKGYGEENDYSLRIVENGLRNVLCDNVYVAHLGNCSFQELELKPDDSTMQRLLNKHPKYAAIIAEFIKANPLAALRAEIIDKIGHFFES